MFIYIGGFHSALVTESGAVYTWGEGAEGQLGNVDNKKDNIRNQPIVISGIYINIHITNLPKHETFSLFC